MSDISAPAGGSSEVIEFDVVTASSDDGEYLYVEDSSSGTDVRAKRMQSKAAIR